MWEGDKGREGGREGGMERRMNEGSSKCRHKIAAFPVTHKKNFSMGERIAW